MVRKTIEQARTNLEGALVIIPARYRAGVETADWAGPAGSDAAEKMWGEAMTKAIAEKSRQAGIKKVSNEEWKAKAREAADLLATRLRGALDKYATVFGPILSRINAKAAALPPKTIDYRANITARLIPIVEEWKRASGKLK